ALGILLYEMVVGVVPFDADHLGAMLRLQTREAPLPPSEVCELPPSLEAIILRCLAKPPGERFSSMGELARALRQLDGAPRATPILTARKKSRSPTVAIGCALAALATAATVALVALPRAPATAPSDPPARAAPAPSDDARARASEPLLPPVITLRAEPSAAVYAGETLLGPPPVVIARPATGERAELVFEREGFARHTV